MKLVQASLNPPQGIKEFIEDLGDGENGFTGTPVFLRKLTLREYLQSCCDLAEEENLHPGMVPQTVYWLVDDDGFVVGMAKIRHYLNDKLRIHGGHVGYYIRSDARGRGLGKRLLSLALAELKKLGESRALVTVTPGNGPSIGVVLANGGEFQDEVTEPVTGVRIRRYWIDIESP